MTPIEWGAAGVTSLTLLTAVAAVGKFQRILMELVEWRDKKAIDRPEFVAVIDDVKALVARCDGTDRGLQKLEVEFAKVPGELRSIRELMERDGRETRHDITGIRVGMEKLSDLVREAART